MNATTHQEAVVLQLEPHDALEQPLALQPEAQALAVNSPAGMMLAAMTKGLDPAMIEKMMDLQRRWEAGEAVKAYNAAFAAFKAESIRVVKNRTVTDGPLRGKSYAELFSVLDAVTPMLSKHGLSTSWKLTKDEPQWLEITCILKHVGGHFETASMGGPPDVGGAKTPVQARASTKTFLERQTLKSVCGVAEGGDDDNGGNADIYNSAEALQGWIIKAESASDAAVLNKIRKQAGAFFQAEKDVNSWNRFKLVCDGHAKTLAGGTVAA